LNAGLIATGEWLEDNERRGLLGSHAGERSTLEMIQHSARVIGIADGVPESPSRVRANTFNG